MSCTTAPPVVDIIYLGLLRLLCRRNKYFEMRLWTLYSAARLITEFPPAVRPQTQSTAVAQCPGPKLIQDLESEEFRTLDGFIDTLNQTDTPPSGLPSLQLDGSPLFNSASRSRCHRPPLSPSSYSPHPGNLREFILLSQGFVAADYTGFLITVTLAGIRYVIYLLRYTLMDILSLDLSIAPSPCFGIEFCRPSSSGAFDFHPALIRDHCPKALLIKLFFSWLAAHVVFSTHFKSTQNLAARFEVTRSLLETSFSDLIRHLLTFVRELNPPSPAELNGEAARIQTCNPRATAEPGFVSSFPSGETRFALTFSSEHPDLFVRGIVWRLTLMCASAVVRLALGFGSMLSRLCVHYNQLNQLNLKVYRTHPSTERKCRVQIALQVTKEQARGLEEKDSNLNGDVGPPCKLNSAMSRPQITDVVQAELGFKIEPKVECIRYVHKRYIATHIRVSMCRAWEKIFRLDSPREGGGRVEKLTLYTDRARYKSKTVPCNATYLPTYLNDD
ncbi:hypothetical protein B0H16DRAFT_1815771 [Mycena metata]|uniref:Uncharacterized protein n=1 Tax=Mycena metata TaxID=1033252 RepID=A0AAD7H441_9AGAR|nr:hypothetical protein B0H16DRAFT_1815771 [Mycena metata]